MEAVAAPAVASAAVARFRPRYPGQFLLTLRRDQIAAIRLLDEADPAADVVEVPVGPARLLLVRHPDVLRALLVERNADFTKARGLRLAKMILGEGLLTSEIPRHERQRRLILPAFHHARLRTYAGDMARLTDAETAGWTPGAAFAANRAMNRLALAIAGRTLFGSDVLGEAGQICRARAGALAAFDRAQHPLAEWFARLPTPNTLRTRRARVALDHVVYGLIHERRAAGPGRGGERGDLLEMLLAAQDEQTGLGMTDEEVRDEAMTLLLAGHETTANALAWTLSLLAEHPDAEARLHAEVDAALDGRPPAFDDLPRLPYTRQVFAEAMRLRPPAWVVGREAARDTELAGVRVRRGTTVLFAPLFLHRDPRFWDEPLRFDPARFAPDEKRARHKFAYLPFSAGRRGCIGEGFAWMEGVLVLAAVARRWRLRLSGPVPPPHGSVTLRPSAPVRMVAEPRG